mmetsp:Transcript_34850/g.76026  ORF Transcript_34850/g.76026 Transcript_34850/m.76026 type:complete len:307 (-) Transcript_34850:234-1154(-)
MLHEAVVGPHAPEVEQPHEDSQAGGEKELREVGSLRMLRSVIRKEIEGCAADVHDAASLNEEKAVHEANHRSKKHRESRDDDRGCGERYYKVDKHVVLQEANTDQHQGSYASQHHKEEKFPLLPELGALHANLLCGQWDFLQPVQARWNQHERRGDHDDGIDSLRAEGVDDKSHQSCGEEVAHRDASPDIGQQVRPVFGLLADLLRVPGLRQEIDYGDLHTPQEQTGHDQPHWQHFLGHDTDGRIRHNSHETGCDDVRCLTVPCDRQDVAHKPEKWFHGPRQTHNGPVDLQLGPSDPVLTKQEVNC